MEACQEVGIDLFFFVVCFAVVTAFGVVGKVAERTGVAFVGRLGVRVVNAYAAAEGQVRKHLIGELCAHHVAVLVAFAEVAVVNPVGVLDCEVVCTVTPVLSGDLAGRIVNLVCANLAPVVAAGEEVSAHDRVHIRALVDHVAVGLIDVACVEVKGHLVVEEFRRVADVEVVTVVAVVRNDAFRVYGCNRCVGLVLFSTGGECNRVGGYKTGAKIIVGHVVAIIIIRCKVSTPAVAACKIHNTVLACAIVVLEAREDPCAVPFEVGSDSDLGLAGLAFLGGDDDSAVGCVRSVKGGSGSTGQH